MRPQIRDRAAPGPRPELAVSVRLVAPTEPAIAAAIQELQRKHGRAIRFSAPRRGRGGEWLAYGILTI